MLPLPEVHCLQLGSLACLQHEMETNAQLPVSFEALVSSESTPDHTTTDADVLIRVESIDECMLAFQAAYNASAYKLCKIIRRDVIRYANEICQCRQPTDRISIMNTIYQRMKNSANMKAANTLETKLRDPCCKLKLHDEAQRDECLKALKTVKRVLADHNIRMQRLLCE